jgi:uncharacterized protein (TIGR04222 family)
MSLNPFDLRGPEFLAFYTALSFIALIICIVWQQRLEARGPAVDEQAAFREIARDPCQIAYLRGGVQEVLCIAAVALLDRGLLTLSADKLKTTAADAMTKARLPLEKAILSRFHTPQSARELFSDDVILREAEMVGEPLREKRLLRDPAVLADRKIAIRSVTFFLWAVSVTKIGIAFSRGHTNVELLILLTVIVTIILAVTQGKGRTARGARIFARINTYFSGLKNRRASIHVGGGSGEATYYAAVFGLTLLPAAMVGLLQPLQAVSRTASLAGSSCGFTSSCGGSSSCSGGSSCGGGGCGGGGCGGCGG